MASFTQLNDADITAIAELFELGAVAGWRVIDAGTINSNYAVDLADHTVFVRINEGKDEADVRYETDLVSQLAALGVPTPCPRMNVYAGKYVSVFPWVRGGHIAPRDTRVGHTRAVGAALAQLHVAGQSVDVVERYGSYTLEHIVARFEGFCDSDDPVLAEAIAAIAEEIDWLQAHSDERAAAEHGIIHGDLFRDNVLFDGTELVGLIDFEQASRGSFVYDLAVCLNDWCYGDLRCYDRDLVAGMVAGYVGVRPLSEPDRAALDVECRSAAMRFTVTRITDVYLARTGVRGKDFRDYLHRLLSLRRLGSIMPIRH